MTQDQTPAVVQDTSADLAPVSIKDTVLAQFKEAEATITTLAAKYLNVAYDVATPKGMREAVAARADLRDNGRLFVTKSEDRIKGEVNDLKRLMASEVTRLVAIVKPVEDSIDAQIKAEEFRKAEEKAKRDREEAARVAAHRANIEKIKGYLALAQGHTIEVIDHAAESLSNMSFGPEWEEFSGEAIAARDATIAGLDKLIASERQRLENERLQKELAEARAALELINAAKETAEREARELVAAEQAKAEKAAREKLFAEEAAAGLLAIQQAAEAKSISELAEANRAIADAAKLPVDSPIPVVTGETMVANMAALMEKAKPVTAPTMTLGELSTKLGFNVTSVFLASLGFEATTVKAAKLFHSEDLPAIGQSIIEHIRSVLGLQSAPIVAASNKAGLAAQIADHNKAIAALEEQIDGMDSALENNQYESHRAAEVAISNRYENIASEACEGSYNYGESEYRQQYKLNGDATIFEAVVTFEYNRHDKTYYYIDGRDYSYSVFEEMQTA